MRFSLRAAAYAAAAASFGGAAAFAGPSFATEGDSVPAFHYTVHAAAAVPVAEIGLDRIEAPSQLNQDVDFSTPVANHALAEAAPAETEAAPAEERAGRSLAELVRDLSSAEAGGEETECLARAVYYESKGEPLPGQLTVAEVVLNRAESGRFPSTVCGVVRQPRQFSFVRRGHIPQPPNNAQWRTAVAIAKIAQQDLADGGAPRALFFHARYVKPGWRNLTRVASIGNHIFYR